MKRKTLQWLSLLAVTALLCGVCPVTFARSAPTVINDANLLQNGDFEQVGAIGYTPNGQVEITYSAAKDGRRGALCTSGDGQWDEYQGLLYEVAVEKNTDYHFSFDHKSDRAEGVILYIKNENQTENIVQSWPTQIPGCWTRLQYFFNSGDNTNILIQLCVGAKNAQRCFDNLRLYKAMEHTIVGGLGSTMDTAEGQYGLAFRFDVTAQVQAGEDHAFLSGTVDPYGEGAAYPLVRMGAVVTNDRAAAEDLTLEAVDGKRCVDIPARKVFDVTEEQASYAVRITNVPAAAQEYSVTARPYYIYEVDGAEVILYGAACTESIRSIEEHQIFFAPGDEWELLWNDEFGGTALNEDYWNYSVQTGGGDRVSYYTTSRPENVRVEDGRLVLSACKETVGSKEYTIGHVTTADKFSFLYGRLEFRAKMPYGRGLWPALWTLGDYYQYTTDTNGWPYGGEIDIMEMVGESNTDPAEWNNRTTTHNLHWGYDYNSHFEVGSYKLSGYDNNYTFPEADPPSADYHVYAIEWDYRRISFFVDEKRVKMVTWGTDSDGKDYLAWYGETGLQGKTNRIVATDAAGNQRSEPVSCADLDFAFSNENNAHWLIMNVALCDGWGNLSNMADGGNLPQSMYVDYVRVYQRPNDGNG